MCSKSDSKLMATIWGFIVVVRNETVGLGWREPVRRWSHSSINTVCPWCARLDQGPAALGHWAVGGGGECKRNVMFSELDFTLPLSHKFPLNGCSFAEAAPSNSQFVITHTCCCYCCCRPKYNAHNDRMTSRLDIQRRYNILSRFADI